MATTTTSSTTTIQCCVYDAGYLRSVPGILKIVEAVLCLIAFLCGVSTGGYWMSRGLGWLQFVTISACIAVMIIFFLYLFNIVARLHVIFSLLVLIFYIVYDVFLLVAGILAAVQASNYRWYHGHEAIAAAAAFTFLALIAFIIDTVLQFKRWRIVRTGGGSSTTTTTTVTTHSSYVTKA